MQIGKSNVIAAAIVVDFATLAIEEKIASNEQRKAFYMLDLQIFQSITVL